jgi:adenylosuccinate synthase
MTKHSITVVNGTQHGDEGKGKIVTEMLKTSEFDWCVRTNGGDNAGHTIYIDVDGEKVKIATHIIPSGIVNPGVKCLIGSGCVVHIKSLNEEITMLEKYISDVRDRVYIADNAHIVTDYHIQDDIKHDKVGSTCRGIGPCYRSKVDRTGVRFGDVYDEDHFDCKIIDPVDLFMNTTPQKILVEGAQGFLLDIDHGTYPHCTSSSCATYNIGSSGLRMSDVVESIGCCKIYHTYVGTREMQEDDEIFDVIQKLGGEVGVTTGRQRQCLWLNLDDVRRGIYVNETTKLIINKCDIIEKVNEHLLANKETLKTKYKTAFNLICHDEVQGFDTFDEMKKFIEDNLDVPIVFSASPYEI